MVPSFALLLPHISHIPIIFIYLKTERLRPLVLELDLIKRLSTLLFQMGIDEKLQLLIVDTFCVLTEISNNPLLVL